MPSRRDVRRATRARRAWCVLAALRLEAPSSRPGSSRASSVGRTANFSGPGARPQGKFSAMSRAKKRAPIVVRPGAGREYPLGPLRAVFKADGEETLGRYSISEWWLEPY